MIVQASRRISTLALAVAALLGALSPGQDSAPTTKKSNALAGEKSPYLRQHAENPVDWRPWGPAALAEAKKRNCVIFVSVGYAACHWCHVMEKESFDDPAVAAFMNANFVNVKIDREERPDLDAMFQLYVMAVSRGQGGWPTSIWLTPDEKPIWAATYYPDVPKHGLPAFKSVCEQVVEAWKTRGPELSTGGAKIVESLQKLAERQPSKTLPDPAIVATVAGALLATEDMEHGGFGPAPRFPRTTVHELLMLEARRSGAKEPLEAVVRALDAMARGGVYDQIGGGIHRYSTDDKWLVPHFEKMLYDQALIARTYLEAWQATGERRFADTAVDLLDAMLRDFKAPQAAFWSSYDATTEGKEGKFYIWTKAEIEAALSKEEAAIAAARFGLAAEGNFVEQPGAYVLAVQADWREVAALVGKDEAKVRAAWPEIRRKLFVARAKRPAPGLDSKIVVDQNGMAIAALARAGRLLGRQDYLEAALAAAAFIDAKLVRKDGRYFRRWCDGEAAHQAILADYAWMARAHLELAASTGEHAHLARAAAIVEQARLLFEDPKVGGYFESAVDATDVLVRRRDAYDSAVPSATAVIVDVLLRLAALLERDDLRESAERTLRVSAADVEGKEFLAAYPALVSTLAMAATGPLEVVLIGDPDKASTKALRSAILAEHLPEAVFVMMSERQARAAEKFVPLVRDRGSEKGEGVVFVCRRGACMAPATTVEAWREALRN